MRLTHLLPILLLGFPGSLSTETPPPPCDKHNGVEYCRWTNGKVATVEEKCNGQPTKCTCPDGSTWKDPLQPPPLSCFNYYGVKHCTWMDGEVAHPTDRCGGHSIYCRCNDGTIWKPTFTEVFRQITLEVVVPWTKYFYSCVKSVISFIGKLLPPYWIIAGLTTYIHVNQYSRCAYIHPTRTKVKTYIFPFT